MVFFKVRAGVEAGDSVEARRGLKNVRLLKQAGSEVVMDSFHRNDRIQSITTCGDKQVHSMMAMATSMGVTAGQMDGVMRSACDNGHESGCCGSSGQDHDVSRIHTGTRKCKTEEEKLAQVRSFPRPDSSRRRRPRMGSTAN